MREYRRSLRKEATLGFVPTMGALHDGHIQLTRHAKEENDVALASVFVNPTQFSEGEDFGVYPRTLERDIELLKEANVDCVFAPNREDIYGPEGYKPVCHVEPTPFNHIYEGQIRPEFFRGIATVVTKLFNIVTPTSSYFGQKDITQCALINSLVYDLHIPVSLRFIETIRESSGLAMSSRNQYLSPEEKSVAGILYTALEAAKAVCTVQGRMHRDKVKAAVMAVLETQPMVSKVEYISVCSHKDMQELDELNIEEGGVIHSAIRVGKVRIIDNVLVGKAVEDILGSARS